MKTKTLSSRPPRLMQSKDSQYSTGAGDFRLGSISVPGPASQPTAMGHEETTTGRKRTTAPERTATNDLADIHFQG